jgi:hypothetical protein
MYEEISRQPTMRGPANLPFASASGKLRARTVNGVHIITIPDEYFTDGTGAYDIEPAGLAAVGVRRRRLSRHLHVDPGRAWVRRNLVGPGKHVHRSGAGRMEGTPFLCKVQLSSAAHRHPAGRRQADPHEGHRERDPANLILGLISGLILTWTPAATPAIRPTEKSGEFPWQPSTKLALRRIDTILLPKRRQDALARPSPRTTLLSRGRHRRLYERRPLDALER